MQLGARRVLLCGERAVTLSSPRPWQTAVHEASHAVVGLAMCDPRLTLLRVTISRTRGSCDWRYAGRGKPDPLVLGVTALAGHAGELEFRMRTDVTEVPASDHRQVLALGFRGFSLSTLLSIAKHIVVDHKDEIRTVARELVKRNLKGSEVEKILFSI